MHNDPTTTRTGIVIGSAWTPQRTARYAEAIETHRVTRWGHRAVAIVGTLILAGFALGWLQ